MGTLRLLLALLVVYFHAGMPFAGYFTVPDGRAAVQLFFLISGFYMALVLNEKYRTAAANGLFYTNRFLRLWPAIVLVNTLVLASFVLMGEVRLFGLTTSLADFFSLLGALDPLALALVLASNVLVFGQDWLWFLRLDPGGISFSPFPDEGHNGSAYSLNHPLFTVAIEAFYYLISPFVLRRGWRVLLGFVLAGAVYHLGVYALGFRGLIWSYHFVGSAAYFYFMGALAYHLYRLMDGPSMRPRIARRPALAWSMVAAGLLVLLPIDWLLPRSTLFLAPVMAVVVPLLFILTRGWRRDRLVGELSFGIYLAHYPILKLLPAGLDPTVLWAAVSGLSILAALLLHRFLDQPIDRWRQRRAAAAALSARSDRMGLAPAVAVWRRSVPGQP